MILATDTDFLVHWALVEAPRHEDVQEFLRVEIEKGNRIALVPQVIFEFLHVTTDRNRFEKPLSMDEAASIVFELWDSRETVRILPSPLIVFDTLELLTVYRLGRKRILDAALAATLRQAGIQRLATLNERDYRQFEFLEVIAL